MKDYELGMKNYDYYKANIIKYAKNTTVEANNKKLIHEIKDWMKRREVCEIRIGEEREC